MHIEKTTTGLIIKEPTTEVKQKCLQYFTLSNPTREFFIYAGDDPDSTSILGHNHDVIYITSGFLNVNDPVIRRLKVDSHKQCPTPKQIELTMNREPRSKLQEDCIQLATTSDASKITMELKPGVELYRHPRTVTCVKNTPH